MQGKGTYSWQWTGKKIVIQKKYGNKESKRPTWQHNHASFFAPA